MKISFLMGIYPSYGGVEKVSTYLANELVKRGHEVSIVSFDQPHPEIAEKELDHRVTLIALQFPISKSKNLETLKKYYRSHSLDILISQWAVPARVAWFCRKAISGTKARYITVHHNDPTTNSKIKGLELKIENKDGLLFLNKLKLWGTRFFSRLNLRIGYDLSDAYVVLSDSFKSSAKRYMLLGKGSEIVAIPNPLTISPPPSVMEKKNNILFIGRIENNQKRTLRLLDIWSHVCKKLPDWTLTIIGDGPDKTLLKDEIASRQLERITLTGFTSPIPYLIESKILLLVSEYEGFGLVITEAMSYRVVPIVLNSFTACRDTIFNHSVGYAVDPPFNSETFAQKIVDLANDNDKMCEISRNAQNAVKRFEISNIVDQWEKLFAKLKGL
ncbi:glycosyltransferase [Duncaniella muris]|uniref:glycosyltransferase n=1 Tax=Duncaniella muris TaxID=2094150 RepID=UPI001C3C4E66|nr:glycosyltransferase [Duncaniella muris]